MFVKGQKHVVDKKFWTQTLNNMDLFSAAFAFVAGQHSTFAASPQPLDAALVTRSCVHAKLPGMDKREGKKARGAEEDEVGNSRGRPATAAPTTVLTVNAQSSDMDAAVQALNKIMTPLQEKTLSHFSGDQAGLQSAKNTLAEVRKRLQDHISTLLGMSSIKMAVPADKEVTHLPRVRDCQRGTNDRVPTELGSLGGH